MRVTCHLVGVVQMVRANPDRNFALGIFAYHLNRPSTNRFSHVNGKQPKFQPSVPFVYLFVCFFNKIIKPLFCPLQLLSFSHARKQIHACTEYLVPLKPKRERDLNVKREEENV